FFFQAEDGIRDRNVTGVQTCALPILIMAPLSAAPVCPLIITSFGFIIKSLEKAEPLPSRPLPFWPFGKIAGRVKILPSGKKVARSEERRVGKESRYVERKYERQRGKQ